MPDAYLDLRQQLSIKYSSENLDLLQLGHFSLNVHNSLNYVVVALAREQLERETGQVIFAARGEEHFFNNSTAVRMKVIKVRNGSIKYICQLILTDLNNRAAYENILENLAASFIYHIGTMAIKYVLLHGGYSVKFTPRMKPPMSLLAGTENLRLDNSVLKMLKDAGQFGREVKIDIQSTSADGSKRRVKIEMR